MAACANRECTAAVQDGALWCEEHLAQFRDRLAHSYGNDEHRRREAVEYIDQWLKRMQRRAREERRGE